MIQIAEANLVQDPHNKIQFIYSIYLSHTELRMYFFIKSISSCTKADNSLE